MFDNCVQKLLLKNEIIANICTDTTIHPWTQEEDIHASFA